LQDKRVHPRVSLDSPVSCEVGSAKAFTGMAKDISMGGVFIESSEVLPFGAEVTIALLFPGAKAEVRLPGIVRWTKPSGFGIQFGSLGARETHALSELFKR